MNRRKFLKWAAGAAGGGVAAGCGYGVLEARWCRVLRVRLGVPNLPGAFEGVRAAFLSDGHLGPFTPLAYVRHVVGLVNGLGPDLVLLGGDYVHKSRRFIAPVAGALGGLRAPLGRFAVLGNHDHWEGGPETSAALARAGITEVTNAGAWLDRGGGRLRVCGVGDLWTDRQDLPAALGDASAGDAVILLSHNPDYVETLTDPRVGLVLSGHTHGGQVVVPGYGAPVVSSRYGEKYLHGLVQGPVARVFVTRGAGTVGPPVRFCCRPEVVLITLTAG